jgi:folate-dependent phosphoribosylglycinamide formyltransferase PurN
LAVPFKINALSEEDFTPIFNGIYENFHAVGFGSGSGSNLAACAEIFKFAGIFSDKNPWDENKKKGAKIAEEDPVILKSYGLEATIGIPRIIINGYQFCGSAKKQSKKTYKNRSLEYNKMIVDELHRFEDENGFGIDLIVLGGYMRMIGEPLLEAYPDKIINVHPADLSLVKFLGINYNLSKPDDYAKLSNAWMKNLGHDDKIMRRFVGEDAVYDAIKAGQISTCSSVIMVDKGIDHGEVLATGPSLDVRADFLQLSDAEKEYVLREVADKHQGEQKYHSDHPLLTTVFKMIAKGRLRLGESKQFGEWRHVYVDKQEMMPYQGFDMRRRRFI